MPDDLRNTGRGDDQRINTSQAHEVTYWTRELNVSPTTLANAVAAVGPMVKDVKKWLKDNGF